ncbi:hypothetical protein MIR68_008907 [Amoeboaphelidium protococcarum]|nr:hypothetical protein MIR68_008907 [Amoeboaphelidium protococcarum]
MSLQTVFSLHLETNGSPDYARSFIRLPPPNAHTPYLLRFIVPAGAEVLRQGCFKTNYPVDGKPFQRRQFYEIQFDYDFLRDGFCDIVITQAGAFEYYIESETAAGMTRSETGFFIVDPRLGLNNRLAEHSASVDNDLTKIMHMDSIALLTLVPKWMGSIEGWREQIQWISEGGYNMIHFVPMQQRGASGSPYSIFDQLELSDDLFPSGTASEDKFQLLDREIQHFQRNLGVLSITDIVWNHTAHNSAWLQQHPEAGYNLINSPHLRPAYELDKALADFSASLKSFGMSGDVTSDADIDRLLDVFKEKKLSELRLWEYYVVDVKSESQRAHNAIREGSSFVQDGGLKPKSSSSDNLVEVCQGVRFGKKLNLEQVLASGKLSEGSGLEDIVKFIDQVNIAFYHEYDRDVITILDNIKNRVRYERLNEHGPKMGTVSKESPIVCPYFTRVDRTSTNKSIPDDALIVANNGWIWNADPLVDFAGPQSKSYLIREVIPWGDCVKLRYGQGPDDNPWLWQHMGTYTKLMAKYFHGFRIDNCHSTPIHVAQYFLDQARLIRPDLYVIAELFTGSEDRDKTFVSKLGINSLIREAMNAWNPTEFSRLLHKYGGQPVGSMTLKADYLPLALVGHEAADINSPVMESFSTVNGQVWFDKRVPVDLPQSRLAVGPIDDPDESGRRSRARSRSVSNANLLKSLITNQPESVPEDVADIVASSQGDQSMLPDQSYTDLHQKEVVYQLNGSSPHALFMDCTHDNETPFQKRTAVDALSTSALVAMANCAVGSVRGFDELVPYNLNIVTESRVYAPAQRNVGIFEVKRIFARLHYLMGQKGYSEIHVNQQEDIISVYRQHPLTHHGYLLIARCAYRDSSQHAAQPIVLRNTSFKPLLSAKLHVQTDLYKYDSKVINGFPSHLQFSPDDLIPGMADVSTGHDQLGFFIRIQPLDFPPGSVILLETDMYADTRIAMQQFRTLMNAVVHGSWYLDGIIRQNVPGLLDSLQDLSLVELNALLFCCDAEERDKNNGNGVYTVPGHGALPFAGIHGFGWMMRRIAKQNNLCHPFCDHLRQGTWAMDYIVNRLKSYSAKDQYHKLGKIAAWLQERFDLVKQIPNFLFPKYFNIIVSTVMHYSLTHCLSLMSDFVKTSNRFTRQLAYGAIQMYGQVPSTGLYPHQSVACVSAGIPHFSTEYMRCWGRDVFISMKGLYLVTGLHHVAKSHILAFASTMKHGLIPNLLDSSRKPRYNARDAVWWFCQAVQDYCDVVDNGISILDEDVKMRFDGDEYVDWNDPRAYSKVMKLRDILQAIMQKHAQGISFREWNAGSQLDHAMQDQGFNVNITFDPATGLIYGGNEWNCGTWMDKMGDSQKSGNFGYPSTPRDGADVEIIGLLKSTLRWLSQLHRKGKFYGGVKLANGDVLAYEKWDKLLMDSFEKHFYIPLSQEDDAKYVVEKELVQRRGIYKDTVGASKAHGDYQFRPNLVVAMAVAPEMFNREHAYVALSLVGKYLLGPLGLKTLDPEDPEYRGNYHNSDDSSDPTVAHGANYHQGPEWVWVLGFFLKALYKFRKNGDLKVKQDDGEESRKSMVDCKLIHTIQRILHPHRIMMTELSPYAGLPELTNQDGADCFDSCPSQAWSMATILDLLHDLKDDVIYCAINPTL